ncbi:pyridoxal phosphate-dependent aminotransferase [Microbacterium enclense]|uniref:pyridoxal phosphate-dependent aminotransferase n=1 Tax=Microbacterium enclense TaxID=993073 RepID=UPI003D75BCF6
MIQALNDYLTFVRAGLPYTQFDLARSGVPPTPLPEPSQSSGPAGLPEAFGEPIFTRGASGAVFLALLATRIAGARIVASEYPSYPIFSAVAESVGLQDYEIRRDPGPNSVVGAICQAITDGADVVALQDPHNPTGHELSDSERTEILETCRHAGVWVLVDRVFADFAHSPEAYASEPNVMVARSYSKSLGIGTERIGWLSAPAQMQPFLTQAQDVLQGQPKKMEPLIRQRLTSLAARHLESNLALVQRNNTTLRQWLSVHTEVTSAVEPSTLPFATLQLPSTIDSNQFSRELLRRTGTATVPGAYFGLNRDQIRIGLTSPDFSQGLQHISDFIKK